MTREKVFSVIIVWAYT